MRVVAITPIGESQLYDGRGANRGNDAPTLPVGIIVEAKLIALLQVLDL